MDKLIGDVNRLGDRGVPMIRCDEEVRRVIKTPVPQVFRYAAYFGVSLLYALEGLMGGNPCLVLGAVWLGELESDY